MPMTKLRSTLDRHETQAKKIIRHDGKEWWAQWYAAKKLGMSRTAVERYMVHCTWIDRAIETQVFQGRWNRELPYCLADDVRAIRTAMARAPRVPQVDGHVHVKEAVRLTGLDPRALRQRLQDLGVDRLLVPGKSRDGRSLPRRYVPLSAIEAIRNEPTKPAELLTCAGVCRQLDLGKSKVHLLLGEGILTGPVGGGAIRERGDGMSGPRNGSLYDPGPVDRLAARFGKNPTLAHKRAVLRAVREEHARGEWHGAPAGRGALVPSTANNRRDGAMSPDITPASEPTHYDQRYGIKDEEAHAIARQHLAVAEEIRDILRSGQARASDGGKFQLPNDTIVLYGDHPCCTINDAPGVALTEAESNVLESFLDLPAMDLRTLRDRSGQPNADKLLAAIARKRSGTLAPAIILPGGVKNDGGYAVRVIKAPDVGK